MNVDISAVSVSMRVNASIEVCAKAVIISVSTGIDVISTRQKQPPMTLVISKLKLHIPSIEDHYWQNEDSYRFFVQFIRCMELVYALSCSYQLSSIISTSDDKCYKTGD